MNSLTLPLPSGRPTRGTGIMSFFNSLVSLAEGVREGLALAARYDNLAIKSDEELARIGLRRQDVPRAALLGRRR
jgi:uncharacterized protein YjiS (DUF1127 family)